MMRTYQQTPVLRKALFLSLALGLLSIPTMPIHAQTTSITSSGLHTVVTLSGGAPVPTYDITGGTRPGNGTNLFHSFGDFSVGTHDRALFQNDSGLPTTNILSRVTGGHPSNIFGNISTTNFPGANLYLINPAGVLFGATATLNVSGSVTVSTADYLRLADGLRFNAVPGPQDALLSQAPVVAFGFLNPHPRPISVQGATLNVAEEKSLSLIGGDITIAGGRLNAPGGQIDVVSVASRGEVRPSASVAAPPGLSGFQTLGKVTISDGARIATGPTHQSSPFPFRSSGPIVIRGGQLVMDHSTITSSPGGLFFETLHGGDITLKLSDTIRADHSSIEANVLERQGGTVSLEAGKEIRLTDIRVESNGSGIDGTGGPVAITAPLIRIDGSSVESRGQCCGGSVTVQTEQLQLLNGSQINATGGVFGGDVNINAADSLRIDKSGITVSTGFERGEEFVFEGDRVGSISITAGGTVSIQNHGFLAANGGANGGNIVIDAGKSFVSQGHSSVSAEASGLEFVGNVVTGNGGSIVINAAETVRIDQGSMNVSSIVDSSGPGGQAGNISITAGESVRFNHARLFAGTNVGNAGNIVIDAGKSFVSQSGALSASSGNGNGGNIIIQAPQQIGINATLVSTRAGGIGAGGSINLSSDVVRLQNNTVRSTAVNGPGGDITINANDFRTLRSTVDVKSQFGPNGTVSIQPLP